MEREIRIEVKPGLEIEGQLGETPGARGGLVVCHPHPLYGGDMDNPVVTHAIDVAREAGLTTLRFNFRGVGASDGAHDGGRGEQDDARAALAFVRASVPAGPVGLAGYSFGAWVASAAARHEPDLAGLCLIAPPLAMFQNGFDQPVRRNTLVVAGTRDSYCPLPDLERLAAGLPPDAVVKIDGADHFFGGKLVGLGEAIRRWVLAWSRS